MADFSRELWFASERSDEKQNIRMHQIRMRTFGCDLRTFGYEQRTMVSHPNSEIRLKGRFTLGGNFRAECRFRDDITTHSVN